MILTWKMESEVTSYSSIMILHYEDVTLFSTPNTSSSGAYGY